MIVQLLCIFAFYLLIFTVGIYAGMRRDRLGTSADLLLAGRRMPLWIGACTMTATWVGGGYINGTAEAVYNPTSGLVWAQAPWGYAISLILGGLFFAKKMRRLGCTTLLDPFDQRYGKKVAAVLFVPALIGEVFWSAAILVALGMTFGTVTGVDLRTSILISAAVAVTYTVVGGLWSVAYTDVVQLVCMLVGLGIALPFAVGHVGSTSEVADAYIATMPAFPQGPAVWLWLDMALLLMLGGIPWQVYFQRVLACRDDRSAVRLSWIAGLGCLLMAIPAVVIGAVGAVTDWTALGLTAPENSAMVLPEVLHQLTPTPVATIALAAVAAAVMSSVDSSILSASSMFTWNVYRPLFRPEATDRQLRSVLRFAVVLTGVAATWLALSIESVYALWYLCADLVYVILFPQLVAVLFLRVSNSVGAMAGAGIALVLRLGGGEPFLGLPAFIPYPLPTRDGSCFPFRTFAMLAGLATIWIVSSLAARFQRVRVRNT